MRALCLAIRDGISIESHRLLDVQEESLVLGSQRRLNWFEPIKICGQSQLRCGPRVSLVKRSDTFLQLFLGD